MEIKKYDIIIFSAVVMMTIWNIADLPLFNKKNYKVE